MEGVQEAAVEAGPALLDRTEGVPEPMAALVERAEVALERVTASVERVPRELQAQVVRAASRAVGPARLVARPTPATVAAVASAESAPRPGPHARLAQWRPGCA
jgi:hypothetical protein